MRNLLFGLIAVLGAGGAGPGLAQSADTRSATVVRDGDAALTCSQMADEAATLSAASGAAGGGGLLGRLGGMARAGAAMVVPGAGLALAGADAVTAPGRERREARTDAGRDRWNYLNGLYAGKGCGAGGEATEAVQTAQTSPETVTTPTRVAMTPVAAGAAEPASPAVQPEARPRIQPTTSPF